MDNNTWENVINELKSLKQFCVTVSWMSPDGQLVNTKVESIDFPTRDLAVVRQQASGLIHGLYAEKVDQTPQDAKANKIAAATKNMLE